MTTTSIATDEYRKVLNNRGNKATPDYTVPSDLIISVDFTTPNIGDSSISKVIPISDGSVLDNGSTNLTGSSGGDNSTDNTSIYKEGAGESDATAQNLIKNNTNATAVWTGVIASPYGVLTSYAGCFLYIKDSTSLAKFVSVEVKIGSDSSNYYSETYLVASLSTGWNWLSSEDVLQDWTETGTVSGNIDYFAIEIVTNNTTDTFVAGDVVYDLLRQWTLSDTLKSLISGYPSINETTLQTDHSFLLTILDANGFFVTKMAVQNTDSTPKVVFESLSDGDSKSSTDQWRVSFKNRLR